MVRLEVMNILSVSVKFSLFAIHKTLYVEQTLDPCISLTGNYACLIFLVLFSAGSLACNTYKIIIKALKV